MSYEFYKILHIFGVVFLFMTLGGLTLHAMNGGTKDTNKSRRISSITHGLALFVILFAGMGLLARIGIASPGLWPVYVYLKLVIWLLMGAVIALIVRKPAWAKPLWFALPLLGGVAAWLAIGKPFMS